MFAIVTAALINGSFAGRGGQGGGTGGIGICYYFGAMLFGVSGLLLLLLTYYVYGYECMIVFMILCINSAFISGDISPLGDLLINLSHEV